MMARKFGWVTWISSRQIERFNGAAPMMARKLIMFRIIHPEK